MIYADKKNFFLKLERMSSKGLEGGMCIIKTSGYTNTPEAAENWSWLKTQMKVLPKSDRSKLPDPLIGDSGKGALKPYKNIDATVFTLYFSPMCKGLNDAMQEAADFFDNCMFPKFESHAIVGHSKGGLFAAGITKYLRTKVKIVLVAPTFGTIMGDEDAVVTKLLTYRNSELGWFQRKEGLFYIWLVRLVGSRRPIDLDMAIGSKFLNKELDLTKLSDHNFLLIVDVCPKGICSISDMAIRRFGKAICLDNNGDAMVATRDQMLPARVTRLCNLVLIAATHPTVLGKSGQYITKFLMS